jgi:hypothetical protein
MRSLTANDLLELRAVAKTVLVLMMWDAIVVGYI